MNSVKDIWEIFGLRYQSHPWHGVFIGDNAPEIVTTYIECVPTDTVKYELDKKTGHLKVDRPQKFSNLIPALYGFIPQTYCGDVVADYCTQMSGEQGIVGDNDPLDICILTEKNIMHGDILVSARPIGGFRMIDGDEADDKIIAILKGDEVYKKWNDVSELPDTMVARLQHYFLTYNDMPGQPPRCRITHVYGREEALDVIRKSQEDYQNTFGKIEDRLSIAAMEALDIANNMKKTRR